LALLAALMTDWNFSSTEAGSDSPSEKKMRVLRPGSFRIGLMTARRALMVANPCWSRSSSWKRSSMLVSISMSLWSMWASASAAASGAPWPGPEGPGADWALLICRSSAAPRSARSRALAAPDT
jgi:hypothetical protein